MSSAPPSAPPARPEPRLAETSWSVQQELQALEELRGKAYEPTFSSVKDTDRCFIIDTPPPYPSGRWHIGAVAHYALIDVIARSRRMQGERVLFPFGLDRNGINIELVVEKKHKRKMDSFDRAEFLDLCQKEIEQYSNDLIATAQRVGMSCDWQHVYKTDAPEFRALTQRTFIELWHKGKVVQELRPNNYCPDCRTTIADAEVLREERTGKMVTVGWLLEGGQELRIATTRPELIPACQAVLVNPDDDRYKSLIAGGTKPQVHLPQPFGGRSVPLLTDPGVDPAFGTGAMMVCSYGDFSDVERFRRFGLQPIAAISPDGFMTEAAGPLAREHVKKARDKAIELLQAQGNVVEVKDTLQQVPICERSRTPIEIVSLKEWYVKQVEVADELRRIAHGLDFHPAKHRQILLDWLDTISIDWPVSRRRYYHTEIPIWTCTACEQPHVPKPGPYYQPWRQPAPPEIAKGCTSCGDKDFVGETKVFDTWMDSSGSNLWCAHYHDRPAFFQNNFPTTIRPQGRDIVRTWLHYTLLKSYQLLGKPGFQHVWITGLGMDEKGRKMSKSLGNVIEPEVILNEFGADAFRFWAASESTIGDDFRISKDRIQGAKKFLSKLHNVARFVSAFDAPPQRPPALHAVDQWILAELNRVVKEATDGYRDFDFFATATTVRNFVWTTFAPHHLEMAKRRAYDGDASATWTLHQVLRSCLLLLAPISPFLTYRTYVQLYGGDIHLARFPGQVEGISADLLAKTPLVEAFNSDVWKRKKEAGLSLNHPLPGVEVPPELADFAADLRAMHGLT